MKGRTKLTPVMQQFAEAKQHYPDAVVFFRLGDFYEMFFEDAKFASRLLGLTLTSRNKENPDSEPMCGVPYHSSKPYIAKLLNAGYKVALCEQLADPSKTKGIVPRGVVRVLTPGTVIDADALEERENHFLAVVEGAAEGLLVVALLDLSTGELLASPSMTRDRVHAELVRYQPKEIVVGPSAVEALPWISRVFTEVPIRTETTDVGSVEPDGELPELGRLEAASRTAALRALHFARTCLPGGIPPIRLSLLNPDRSMRIDETAQEHLELVSSRGARGATLLGAIDRTLTAGGARLLRRRLLAPSIDRFEIELRLNGVSRFVRDANDRALARQMLSAIPDLERIAVRVAMNQSHARDLAVLRDGLRALAGAPAGMLDGEPEMRACLEEVAATSELLAKSLVDRPNATDRVGLIRDGFDSALDAARVAERTTSQAILTLEQDLRQQTGISTLKIRSNSVFGWYIEVSRGAISRVPSDFVRRQTIAGAERYGTPRLADLAEEMQASAQSAEDLEQALLAGLFRSVSACQGALRRLAAGVSELDVSSALAELAIERRYVRPTLAEDRSLYIRGGRHPVVESSLPVGAYVPIDVDMREDRFLLITGPNMAGKSTIMRQTALTVILGQMGAYVPADQAHFGLVDRVLSRLGAKDLLAKGESTFMVEMKEAAKILSHATSTSLVLVDEIGRGTSTFDGLAIAWAVAEALHERTQCRAMFATHFHELVAFAEGNPGARNVSTRVAESNGTITFLRTLVDEPCSRSYGVQVARLAGLPDAVIRRAEERLALLESSPVPVKAKTVPSKGSTPPKKHDSRPIAAATLLESELREADLDRVSPIQALEMLFRWKSRLSDRDGTA